MPRVNRYARHSWSRHTSVGRTDRRRCARCRCRAGSVTVTARRETQRIADYQLVGSQSPNVAEALSFTIPALCHLRRADHGACVLHCRALGSSGSATASTSRAGRRAVAGSVRGLDRWVAQRGALVLHAARPRLSTFLVGCVGDRDCYLLGIYRERLVFASFPRPTASRRTV